MRIVTVIVCLAAWGGIGVVAAGFVGAQPMPGQCVNLRGNWASNSDFTIGLQQSGCDLQSTFTRAHGYEHSIQGQCAGNQCTWTVSRQELSNGCQTVLYGVATMLDPNHFRTLVNGSDGRCELPRNYSETRIYRRV